MPGASSPASSAPSCSRCCCSSAPVYVHDLPQATLAAIVIVAVLSFIDIAALRRLRRWRRSEFVLALLAFAGVAVLGVLWGVGIAIAVSLLNFIRRAWRPHDAVLGRVDNLKGYHDTERYRRRAASRARDLPLRRAAVLCQRRRLPRPRPRAGALRRRALDRRGRRADHRHRRHRRRVACALDDELLEAGVELAFAELKDPVRDRLRRYGLDERIGRFYPTLGVAVAAYLRETGVDWVDWEDRAALP